MNTAVRGGWCRWLLATLALTAVCVGLGCGEDAHDGAGGASAAAGFGVENGVSGQGAVGGSPVEPGPTAGHGGNGTAGSEADDLDCSGSFGQAQTVFDDSPYRVQSPSVTGDGLELFYVRQEGSDLNMQRYAVARRTSPDVPFGSGQFVPELQDVCGDGPMRSVHVSADGLRLYLGCPNGDQTSRPLYVATRADRQASFVVDPAPIGQTGRSVSLSADELEAFSSAMEAEYASLPPRRFLRANTTQHFGGAQNVPGLEQAPMVTPHLTPDGLTMFGAHERSIVYATRASTAEPFGAVETLLQANDASVTMGAPNVSADCRTLYFVRVDQTAGLIWHLQQVSR